MPCIRKKVTPPSYPGNHTYQSAPISKEMLNIINDMRDCKTDREHAGEMLDKAIGKLLILSLEQLTKQH